MSEHFEHFVERVAQDFAYPPMKSVSANYRAYAMQQILKPIAIVILLIGITGFAVPDIRAAVLDFLQIGVVTIRLDGLSANGETLRLNDVYGETDLETVQDLVSFDLLIPDGDLPDRVYVQDGEMVIFVWLDAEDIRQVLYQVPEFNWRVVKEVEIVTQTMVGDDSAYWVDVQHPVQFTNGSYELTYFVQANVLIWTDGLVTYRLETELDMEAARAFAESLLNPSN